MEGKEKKKKKGTALVLLILTGKLLECSLGKTSRIKSCLVTQTILENNTWNTLN